MLNSNLHYMPELYICLSETPFSYTQVSVSCAVRVIPWLFLENCPLERSGRSLKEHLKLQPEFFSPSSGRTYLAKSDIMVIVLILCFSYL